MTDDQTESVIRQLSLIRILVASERTRVQREGKFVRIPKWQAIDKELSALLDFVINAKEDKPNV